MFHIFVLIVLLSISTRLVDGLMCATDCDFSTQIGNATFPNCTIIDKPSTEQSCRVELRINYVSGSIIGRLDARTPPASFAYIMHTVFSLYNEISNVTIDLDCSTTDNCDQDFVEQALRGDWFKVQNQVRDLRKDLADRLFNSSDLRPHGTCPAGQNCSDQGFCTGALQVWSDSANFSFQSACANSTEQPLLEWTQLVEQYSGYEEVSYTCNKPSCASLLFVAVIGEIIEHGYILPFNVTTPPTTTTTGSSTMSTTTASTSSISTTTNNAARLIHLNKIEKIVFAFVSVLLLCLFGI